LCESNAIEGIDWSVAEVQRRAAQLMQGGKSVANEVRDGPMATGSGCRSGENRIDVVDEGTDVITESTVSHVNHNSDCGQNQGVFSHRLTAARLGTGAKQTFTKFDDRVHNGILDP
jgi:hypothetical protein